MLAMYNLSLEGTGRQGYFRWKEDICAFIGRHWNFLLGTRYTYPPVSNMADFIQGLNQVRYRSRSRVILDLLKLACSVVSAGRCF